MKCRHLPSVALEKREKSRRSTCPSDVVVVDAAFQTIVDGWRSLLSGRSRAIASSTDPDGSKIAAFRIFYFPLGHLKFLQPLFLCCSIEIDVRTCRSQSHHLLFDAFVLQLLLMLRAARCLRRVDQCPQVSKGTVSNLSLRFLEVASDKKKKMEKPKINFKFSSTRPTISSLGDAKYGCSHPYLVKVSPKRSRWPGVGGSVWSD